MPVDYAYLTVVSPVDARGKKWERHLEKRVYIDSSIQHFLEKPAFDLERAHMVVYDSDFYPCAGSFYQYVADTPAGIVVLKYIILEMDEF